MTEQKIHLDLKFVYFLPDSLQAFRVRDIGFLWEAKLCKLQFSISTILILAGGLHNPFKFPLLCLQWKYLTSPQRKAEAR